MYKAHKDHPNKKWNVFFETNGKKEFIRSFDTVEEANEFCSINNWK